MHLRYMATPGRLSLADRKWREKIRRLTASQPAIRPQRERRNSSKAGSQTSFLSFFLFHFLSASERRCGVLHCQVSTDWNGKRRGGDRGKGGQTAIWAFLRPKGFRTRNQSTETTMMIRALFFVFSSSPPPRSAVVQLIFASENHPFSPP